MKPERWQRVEQLYHSALEREDGQRAAFLAAACAGDDSLRREVESLLAHQTPAENLLERPVMEVAAKALANDQADSMLGRSLGSYQVLSLLGAGGMGEVYCARDTRLDRTVALKILPAEVAADAERMRRFVREAKAASALNHPHVATIYDIGEAEGLSFIAMEYVEGQTLAAKINGHPLEVSEIVEIGSQIADALDEAHGKGITHRDIKPANVMLNERGQVKVLDFGLAKITRPATLPIASDISTMTKTAPGVVLGTVPYMSPEQALGRDVDHRSDLFSLGVMLYEMATGRLPFSGANTSETLDRILHAQPEAMARFNYDVPAELERIVRKCLEKERDRRYQSARDLLVDLKNLYRESASTSRLAVKAEGLTSKANPRALLALVMLAVAGAGIAIYKFLGPIWPAAPTQVMEIRRLTQTGKATHAAISPDGKYVVHVMDEAGRQSLLFRHVATKSDTQIVPPAEANYRGITFSPDGNFIYYVRGKPQGQYGDYVDTSGVLYRTTILGKDEKKLIENVHNNISLSPDGSRLAFVRQYVGQAKSVLIEAQADGTGEKELATRKGPANIAPQMEVAWSPDGEIIALFFDHNIVGVRVADGAEFPITSHRWEGAIRQMKWLPDGSGLLVVGRERNKDPNQIWRLSYPGGVVQKVTNDLSDYVDLSLTADSRTVSAVQSDRLINIWIAPDGDASHIKQLTSGAGREDGQGALAWTPDGKIVFCSMAGGVLNVWIMEADGTSLKQLTFNNTGNIQPAVSPDGRYIVWSAGWPRNIWRMDIDGGNLKQLTNGVGEWCPQYSPDGKWLIYVTSVRLWKMPVDSGAPIQLNKERSYRPSISPDGKLIAFNLLNEASGQWTIAIMLFEGGPPIKVFDIQDSVFRPIIWTPDGRAVAYPVYRGGATNIWAQPLDGGRPKQLTDFRDGVIFEFAWARDGKQLALSRGMVNSDVVLISNFK